MAQISGLDLRGLQTELQTLLSQHEWLGGVRVVCQASRDPEAELEEAMAKTGLCIVISTPRARQSNPNVPRPLLDQVSVSVTVYEHPAINRAGTGWRTALETAQIVHAILLGYAPDPAQVHHGPIAAEAEQFVEIADPNYYAVQLRYRTAGSYVIE